LVLILLVSGAATTNAQTASNSRQENTAMLTGSHLRKNDVEDVVAARKESTRPGSAGAVAGSKKGKLRLTIYAAQPEVCQKGTVPVAVRLKNLGKAPVLVDTNLFFYQAFVIKKNPRAYPHPDEMMTSVSDPVRINEGNIVTVAAGQTFKKTFPVSLNEPFFNDITKYKLEITYGQLAQRRIKGQDLFFGTVKSNWMSFKVADCKPNLPPAKNSTQLDRRPDWIKTSQIDPNIYVEFKRRGAREPLYASEGSTGIWLKLHNNSNSPIVLNMGGVPSKAYGDAALIYDVLTGGEVTNPDSCHVCSFNSLHSGHSILFSVPAEDLAEGRALRIRFSYPWEDSSTVAPDRRPEHFVYFNSSQIPSVAATVGTAKCGQVRESSKQNPGPPLLPCGPNITLTNAATFPDSKTVMVSVLLNESGKIVSARAISGDPAFYANAINAVNKMKFNPKRLSGRPVKTELNVKVVVNGEADRSLCSLQQNVGQGNHERVRVAGLYGPGLDRTTLEDPVCSGKSTWIELDLQSKRNREKLRRLLQHSKPVYVVLDGDFYGPPMPDPKLPKAILKSYRPGWGHLAAFPTKLVVHAIREVRTVATGQNGVEVGVTKANSAPGLTRRVP